MPDVRDLETRDKFKGLGPIRPRVPRDGGFGVPLRALLHVAGLGRAAAVQAGAIAPFGIELDTIRRVGGHYSWAMFTQDAPPRHFTRWGPPHGPRAFCEPQGAPPRPTRPAL